MREEPTQGPELVDREEIRAMCEENWRQFLGFAAAGSRDLGQQVILRFDSKNKERADRMDPAAGKAFLAVVEEEREKIFDEYTSNPEGLKRRLGVTAAAPAPQEHARQSNRQGMGEMVAKTAVRASIWAAIWSLFR
ncbi:nucleoside/nucleotide kinase family protein [Paraburkholderia tropica]|uniref:hypothetical protein n=1 Tax=Paraburkholderia tropica TaxID=92647 RepID=UPI002AB74A56|nr:hypothetical protein [Paraburkholderia tropica]